MVRCPLPVQMPIRHGQPTAPTVLVSPLVCACSHILTGDALLACALAGSSTSGGAHFLTPTSARRRVGLAFAPGHGRDRPPPSPCTSTSPTSSSSSTARGVEEAAASSSGRSSQPAADRRARGCRGHAAVHCDRVGPYATRAGSEPRVERARRLEMSSLHAQELALCFTMWRTHRIRFAVPGRSPSVRYS